MPAKVTTSRSKPSETFCICHSFVDKNGKNTSRVHERLGTLAELSPLFSTDRDGVMAWAKERARTATDEYNNENYAVSALLSPTLYILKNEQRSFNRGYFFLQPIVSSLRLNNICRNIKRRRQYEYNPYDIFSDLIFARILHPFSKKDSYAFAQTLPEQPKYILQNVYRALSVIADELDCIQAEIYRNSYFLHKRNTKILYYDYTNYYFKIEQESGNKTHGKSKENRPNSIIGMGFSMDADGFPFVLGLYPGRQNEQKILKPLEQKVIRDLDCVEFIYRSDSGLGSRSNKLLNDMGGRSYVVTQSLKRLGKEDRTTVLDPKQYRKLGSEKFIDLREPDENDPEVYRPIYYKEILIESKKLLETTIVTHSPRYKAHQAKIRQGQIECATKTVDDNGKRSKKNRHNPNDPARLIKRTVITADGEVAEEEYCQLNQTAIDKEAMYDGFYAVMTGIGGNVPEITTINERRWQIEECFRIMKTDFEVRPVYLQREDRIKAHLPICFLALLIYRISELKLDKKYTTENTIATLRRTDVCALDVHGYTPACKRTDLTDDLHELFGFRTDTQIIKKAEMRSIIHQSKAVNQLLYSFAKPKIQDQPVIKGFS